MNAPTRPSILIVDADPNLIMFLADRLRRDGFDARWATTGQAAIAEIDAGWPDAVIVDPHLPDVDGRRFARAVRDRGEIPIIVLSSDGDVDRKVDAIATYAEDYVTKPFAYAELRVRIRRILQRPSARAASETLVLGPTLTLHIRRRRAVVCGREVRLSPMEARLLGVLASRSGAAVSTEELLAKVWHASESQDPANVWVAVRRLRDKIEPEPMRPAYLVSVPGRGYRLARGTDADADPESPDD